ncbi:tRNA (adenosine(37)-N6)-threonylcarbamoyltransferase complex dimerization subunit type 1 TsaB [Roseovarius spongiae]|uniref:tRNA (Adenosine(37)-N6)-threonylcarbamoyltransferase complex dimerization subunit type 1 TsaB n=1 Tax=Roseovarius spongiae TaxID=2320272 RepID=A0A3A8B2R3_9RHOB|nr:tRNA (adenosine(37)-N6)-threonylcarbamoyltransferase complex dimerization subunit type 1 TsaB [Roseovarius spongiae]RKF14095.1 tRNA (adenosine(37)-N6)-threonylcarbamoyltransferase complex dimerization subunit type 1 TsaB [Roseovarius spongiae]
MSEPLVLGVDTSGPWCSAALLRGGDVLADLHEDMPKGQAESLFPLLGDLMARGGTEWRDLAAIGVGTGPGNFTGIRISVAGMRGLGLAFGIPVIGVTLLDAAAQGARGPILASVAAPRGQAYVQGYGMKRDVAPALVAIRDLDRALVEPGLLSIGSAGAEIAAHLGVAHAAASAAPGLAIARIAAARLPGWDGPAAAPHYLKPADAAPARDAPPVMLD